MFIVVTPPDSVAVAAWLAFLTPVALAILAVTQVVAAKMSSDRGVKAAAKADEVAKIAANTAKIVAEKVEVVAKVAAATASNAADQNKAILENTEKIHTLVNSQHGLALALVLEKAIKIASLTNDPNDAAEVKKAKIKLDEHEARQQLVDRKEDKKAK